MVSTMRRLIQSSDYSMPIQAVKLMATNWLLMTIMAMVFIHVLI